MPDMSCALLVIGAGPGGYVCAIRAAQLGLETIIIESGATGGTCLNVGCIPSKALIHAADEFHRLKQYTEQGQAAAAGPGISAAAASFDMARTLAWKNSLVDRLSGGVGSLLKKAGVQLVQGRARFRDGKNVIVSNEQGDLDIRAENLVIATGSEAIELPTLPFGGNIISSTEALSLSSIPESLAVVGGGYIGLEIGTAYAKLGSRVTVVESAERILPQYDARLSNPVLSRLGELGVSVLCSHQAGSYDAGRRQLGVQGDAEQHAVDADYVLVTVGRRPRMQGWGLTELSLTTRDGFVAIDSRCQSSMRGVYAVGDITGEPMLAHRAMAQGTLVAEVVAGQTREWDKACIPAVCFTDPEIVSVGLSPEQAEQQNIPVVVSEFPFHANGRALSLERNEGFIRVVCREDNQAVAGIQAVGSGIAELSAGFALAIEMGSRSEDIAATVHAHPTLSEGFQEACLKALGHALHI